MPVDVVLFVFVGNKAQIVDGLSVVQCRELLSQLDYLRWRIVQRLRFGIHHTVFQPALVRRDTERRSHAAFDQDVAGSTG